MILSSFKSEKLKLIKKGIVPIYLIQAFLDIAKKTRAKKTLACTEKYRFVIRREFPLFFSA